MKKNIKKFVISVFLALTVAACGTQVPLNSEGANPQPSLTVTGSGQVLVVPDIAYINVGVRSEGPSVSEAISVNNGQAQAIKDALVAAGVAEEDIQTANFNVYQSSNYDFQGQPTNTFYVVENTVNVTVRQIGNLGGILDTVARSGANNIYGVNFDVADKSAAQTSARNLAVQAAQKQAGELAQAAGVTLGDIISINASYTTTTPFYGYGMGGGGAAMAESVPIASGQLPVNAQVTMTFMIK